MLPQPTIPTALDPLLGVGPSPHEPRDVDLPGERAVSRSFEDEFERRPAPVLWFEFPMVVVVAEPNPLALKALGHSPEFLAERTPAFGRHVALLGRHCWHEKICEAQRPARVEHRFGLFSQSRKADMA